MSGGREVWDLVVVGGGTAGIVASTTAAQLGARVLLVERDRTGGDCLWTGCVPSKALLAAAHAAADARRAGALGVTTSVHVDFAAVMAHVHRAVAQIAPVDSPQSLESQGVTVRHGTARFTGPDTVGVDGEVIRFRHALLAGGAEPAVPSLPGLDTVHPLTSETVWDLDSLPSDIVLLGGGSVGCELGQAFARLGSTVTIVETSARLLPQEDPEASALVASSLRQDGVDVLLGRSVASVEADDADTGPAGRLRLADGQSVRFDRLLLATGRSPRTADVGLDRVGVELDDQGFVVVDEHLRTSNPRIWAAGDLTGHPQYTHVAGVHGSVAATNAVLGVRRSVAGTGVPRVTFTQPEVAAVGVATGPDAARHGGRVLSWPHSHADRAVTEDRTEGFSKIVADRRGRIVGATVVGPRAGETLGELAVAVAQGLRVRDLAGVTHAYPTWNDGVWNAAIADLRGSLRRPGPRTALRSLVRVRRWWVDRRSG